MVIWSKSSFFFNFYNDAYRGEYVFTTPGLLTAYAIVEEGSHYRTPLPVVNCWTVFQEGELYALADKSEEKTTQLE